MDEVDKFISELDLDVELRKYLLKEKIAEYIQFAELDFTNMDFESRAEIVMAFVCGYCQGRVDEANVMDK